MAEQGCGMSTEYPDDSKGVSLVTLLKARRGKMGWIQISCSDFITISSGCQLMDG